MWSPSGSGLAQADAALAVRRPLATADYSTARGADADAVTQPEIPLRLSNGQVLPTECDEQSVAVGCNPRITPIPDGWKRGVGRAGSRMQIAWF
jgi:hypothetical protein